MYFVLGIVFFILALVTTGFVVWTIVWTIIVEKQLVSKRNLVYMIPSFLLMYFLYLTGMHYNAAQNAPSQAFGFFDYFHLFSVTLDVFGFKLQSPLISGLASEYPLFYADFVMADLLCAATGILSILSFFSLQLYNFIVRSIALTKECDIVLGDSQSAIKYAKNNRWCILWCENLPRARYFELLSKRVIVCRKPFASEYLAWRLRKREHHLILFRDADYSYSKILDSFRKLRGNRKSLLYLHLEANIEETKIIKEKLIAGDKVAHTFVTCFNKYELLARQFIREYPISKYVPREFFNGNFTLKDEKEINVVFIGFGKVNYELFKLAAMQFQFAKTGKNGLRAAPVNYFVYDMDESRLHNEYFSRFKFEFDRDFENTDFPKPDKVCNLVHDECIDIHSVEARKRFCELVNQDTFTYFIVSLSSELEDASYAQTLDRMIKGKGAYKIFVRAKDTRNEVLGQAGDKFVYFGEEQSIYAHECIVDEDLMTLARLNHVFYETHKDAGNVFNEALKTIKSAPDGEWNGKLLEIMKGDPSFKLQTIQLWEKLSFFEQLSNIYSVMNLPFKLGLMGLSLQKKNGEGEGISFKRYCTLYQNPYMSENCDDPDAVNRYTDYRFFFGTKSSNVLAYVEHLRWNACYILSDYKQMSKEDMKGRYEKALEEERKRREQALREGKKEEAEPREVGMKHKDTGNKLHACITTHSGLDELIRFKYSVMNPSGGEGVQADGSMTAGFRELSKIYAYDYTDLDKIYHHLMRLGYVITEE